MQTPFGTVDSANITPDPASGIGGWSDAAFARALKEGVARNGSHLYPAFPYDHTTRLTDDDISALYAYVMTRDPVAAPAHANSLVFPLNFRPRKLLPIVRDGIHPGPDEAVRWMPAFGSTLTDEQLTALAAWNWSSSTSAPPACRA